MEIHSAGLTSKVKAGTKTIAGGLLHLRASLRSNGLAQKYAGDLSPLRSELFSADQMEQHGKALASSHELSPERKPDQLLARLADNEAVLIETCDLLIAAVKAERRITPASEWLLDNFYLVEEQIRTAKRHLPKEYSQELPRLLSGPSAGLPRVYDIALETIAHGDGRVDPEGLSRFVAAYQQVKALKLGELWAIPIMLRLALIENLRRVGTRIAAGRIERDLADSWADRMMEIAEKDPKSLILVTADMARSNPPMVSPFVAEFARRLQGQSSVLALPLTWVEHHLSENGLTIEQLVQSEIQQQAADQVSISNSIGSLRFLGAMDWREFVETMSVVEQTLREDSRGTYGKMDFATRDRYRHIVERIAKTSPLSEGEVARKAVQLAQAAAAAQGAGDRTAHVGFYLIDKGLPQLERSAEAPVSSLEAIHRVVNRFPLLLYLSPILLMTVLFTGEALEKADTAGVDYWLLALIGVLAALCGSQLSISLVNWLATLLAEPHKLPRMDFSEGIPSESRTLVVVPAMLISAQNVEELVEALEVRFLANRCDNLHFGLLTDFRDAPQQSTPDDEPLLQLAQKRIEELNEKYWTVKDETFFLFHRPRRWNPQERMWMGYERKRGKLADLNSFLRGGGDDRFSLVSGKIEILSNVKYVITLDADTQLPRDAAWQCVGAMAHPLNRAVFDESKQRVARGYGILQPRVAVSLPSTGLSAYARLAGSEPGIDPYTLAISDVYQDLFSEGSFIGKGIYDVDAFEKALADRFPENRILSHDLLEGCYTRSGLLSDVQLYEEYPARYSADVARRHRWIRGDWQIARWLLPRVPGIGMKRRENPLSGLSRWKIFDNLRRSLVPAGLTLLLLLGWTILTPVWWTLSATGIILIPPLIATLLDVFRKPEDVLFSEHFAFAARSLAHHLAQAAFTLTCLPYEAFYSSDAIARTAFRMLVTKRRLLEWNPASGAEAASRDDLASAWQSMWIGPVLAGVTWLYLAASRPTSLAMATPILGLWFASPAIAWSISRPPSRREARLSPHQITFLRKLSRKTWAFFETFVGAEDHWLPPDNFQEHPVAAVAHRTSPTNIGLSLLANLAAYDFGYLSAGKLIDRTANVLQTMETLERSQGHFYNWYDTQSLKPLTPVYISTVDSGNLAGHLLTLRPGLLALSGDRILGGRLFDALADTLLVLMDAQTPSAVAADRALLAQFQRDLESACDSPPETLTAAYLCLDLLAKRAAEIASGVDAAPAGSAAWWAGALVRQCRDALDDLTSLAPWILLPNAGDFTGIDKIPTLNELVRLDFEPSDSAELHEAVKEGGRRAAERMASIERLALQCEELSKMDYSFLFDRVRQLLSIGYNLAERRRDSSCYDLLASEARLCSFIAIAQGQLPQENWFALGRVLSSSGGPPTLISWSGSMFEYLMPLLVMPTYDNTLLDETYKAAVQRQIEYGRRRGVAWGISESGYNTIDARFNYQYRAFGVPGLGLKRGLAEDLVIAPYAAVLALMVAPEDACANLQRLSAEGAEGKYGFYEAIDHTPSRLPRGQSSALVRSFMAHHQGMSFLSIAYVLLDRPMQKRFESDPSFQATTLLLQERVVKATRFTLHTAKLSDSQRIGTDLAAPVRVLHSPDSPVPEVQLLSNGRYHVMVTNAGGGYSRWKDLAITRWREDTTCDNWGSFCYIRDVASGEFWSTAYQPALKRPDKYEVIFSEGRAEFRRRDAGLDTHTEIAVSPEDDIELRRVRITNSSRTRKVLEVTSYAEVVLAPAIADALHPAFSNLFVQTEIIEPRNAILCTRRPQAVNQSSPWMFHLMAVHGANIGDVTYETDRMTFIGRGNTAADPQALRGPARLSGSQGSVLDPVVAIRRRITLDPGKSATVNIVTGAGETRETCLGMIEKYQDWRLAERVFDLAWTHGQVVLQQINATEADAQLYGRLASSVLYASSWLRADKAVLIENHRGQSGLWSYSISGDLPIVLLRIEDAANIELVRQLVQAHAYWRIKGLTVDLVIWNDDHGGYRQLLQDQIMGLIVAGIEANLTDRPGGIFVRSGDHIASEDRILLQSVARAIITDSRGTLEDQIDRRAPVEAPVPRLTPTRTYRAALPPAGGEVIGSDLIFFNGLGGFTPDGREYVINTGQGRETPVPWVNVLANPSFGTVVSESGLAYTWGENAHEMRLTPWNNDPVSDSAGETFYIRDEDSGHFWGPTLLPCHVAAHCVSRHGFGYSVFENSEAGISSEMWVYVALDAPVKFTVLKIRNNSGRSRRLSATAYVEWVLGDLRPKSTMHVITEVDPGSGALFARNPYNTEFGGRVAFFDVDDSNRTVSGDRTEFIGRNGTLRSPAAMARSRLSGKVGAALDPCAAIQVPFELVNGQEREIVFRLGVGRDADDARNLVFRFRGSGAARGELEMVWQYWKHSLGAVNVQTPDQSLNVLTNGWLLYQTLASRFWARSGYYQSGGAFGFRDQLQDVMALIHAEPRLVREHLVLCASRQFREGDVQHWWHPPAGRGVRTHCSDDYLWLPLAVCRYVGATGDTGILDEPSHFLEGRPVNPEEDSYYDLPGRAEESASLYEHCARAIQHGLRFGAHGLPLMGSGDWNDGMNKVGEKGQGESVWLGFFLYQVLTRFTDIAVTHGDTAFAEHCQTEAAQLRQNIEDHAWDGEWYRRAYFDDGSPLGSASNPECQIDSIAQSWSVLSGAGDPEHSHMAMESLDKRLVRRDQGLIQLLDPPFDKSSMDPGYIKGYVPGVRENGGQYTHAAVWATMAFAALGDRRRAWELFGIINPVNHSRSNDAIATYKVEPYVVAADVYARSPHTGRGGWTWYTGSAGWTYRLIVESLLGLRLEVDKLHFTPCLPANWKEFTVHYRYRETVYHITILQVDGDPSVTVDGLPHDENVIPLIDDRQGHTAEVRINPVTKT